MIKIFFGLAIAAIVALVVAGILIGFVIYQTGHITPQLRLAMLMIQLTAQTGTAVMMLVLVIVILLARRPS